MESGSDSFALMKGNVVEGLVVMKRRDWDCEHFGVEIYSLSTFFSFSVSVSLRQALIAHALDRTRQRQHIDQISVHLAAEDSKTVAAFRTLNFTIKGRQQTLFLSKQGLHVERLRAGRAEAVRDASSLPEQEVAELACAIRFPSRLYQEALCSPERVAKMHGSWVRQMLARNKSDRAVRVFLREEKAVGLAACEKLTLPIGCEDVRVFGRTLFGFLSDQAGCALDTLLREGLSDALGKAPIVESTVAESNRIVIRMLLRAGHQVARNNIIMTRDI